MRLVVASAIFIGLLVAGPAQGKYSEGENWPSVKCHPTTEARASNTDSEYMLKQGGTYKECVEKRYKAHFYSACPKICKLVVEQVVTKSGDTYTVDVDAFIDHFADELGYDTEKPEPAQKQLMDKVRAGVNDCKNKHKEIEGMKTLDNLPCTSFDNFLKCFDKTIGC